MTRRAGNRTQLLRAASAALLLAAAPAQAAEPSGEELARKIVDRPRAEGAARVMVLELHDDRGRVRERRMRNFWRLDPEAKRLVFAVQSPPDLKHDAFLAVDWLDSSRDDDQWIYRHARKRAERIGSPRRGQPFLGSDFTLEDIKKEDWVEVDEYSWQNLGQEKLAGRTHWLLEQTPRTPQLATSLGFARAVSHVDPSRWVRRRIRYYDAEGELLRTIDLGGFERDGDVWFPRRIEARSANGHRSVFRIESRNTTTPIPDEVFSVRALERERLGSGRDLPAVE